MKRLTTILLAVSLVLSASAVPARRAFTSYTQPDGTKIMLKLIGDEHRHLRLTVDGYPVKRGADGYYRFAQAEADGRLTATSVKAAPLASLREADRVIVRSIDPQSVRRAVFSARARRMKAPASRATAAAGGIGLTQTSFLGRKDLNGLVILAQYKDVKFTAGNDKAFYTEMLNAEGFSKYGATGSARDYFIDSSNGQFTPTFDVYGPVTLPENMAYYGANDMSEYGNGEDVNPAQMIADACKLLDGQINFKDYDQDGDGVVDNVFVFYAGYGEASGGGEDTVWPHQWDLRSAGISLTLDGVRISSYACSNELESYGNTVRPDGIGTFVHEFSHVIGLPDLYDTSEYNGSWTPATWSVLDQGPYNNEGRTPPAYSAFERYALGWLKPETVEYGKNYELPDILSSNKALIARGDSENEFFLFENRQQSGWDEYLPGHGMLVWHVDFNPEVWQNNKVNNLVSHNYVDIEEACGKWVDIEDFFVEYGDDYYLDGEAYDEALAAYAFPGTKKVTSFTDDTKPSMRLWSGKGLDLPLSNISEQDGVISFMAGEKLSDAEVPVIDKATSGDNYFIARWQPSEGAVDYQLMVSYGDDSAEKTASADFGSRLSMSLPEGWTAIGSLEKYSTAGNFGNASPSLKLANSGVGFSTPEFDGPVRSISFWAKGQNTSGSKLTIEGRVGDTWTTIKDYVPKSNKAETVTIENEIPDGVTQVRVKYTKSSGNLALDDFTVVYGGASEKILPDYNGVSTGVVTSFRVDKLVDGVKNYNYKVRAVDAAGLTSRWSETATVTLGQSSGITDVDMSDAITVEVRTVVYNGVAGETVRVCDIAGSTVASAVTGADGTARIEIGAPGLYVLAAGTVRAKVLLR